MVSLSHSLLHLYLLIIGLIFFFEDSGTKTESASAEVSSGGARRNRDRDRRGFVRNDEAASRTS